MRFRFIAGGCGDNHRASSPLGRPKPHVEVVRGDSRVPEPPHSGFRFRHTSLYAGSI